MRAFSSREFLGIMEIIVFDEDIPKEIKEDVNNRVYQWCTRGGAETDPYIKTQYSYLLEMKELYSKKNLEKAK